MFEAGTCLHVGSTVSGATRGDDSTRLVGVPTDNKTTGRACPAVSGAVEGRPGLDNISRRGSVMRKAVDSVRSHAREGRVKYARHALRQMSVRGIGSCDVEDVLRHAGSCDVHEDETWWVSGPGIAGDEMSVIVALEQAGLVVLVPQVTEWKVLGGGSR